MPDKPQTEMPMRQSVAPDYVHYDKLIAPGPLLTLGPRRLKWYDIGTAERPVAAEIQAMARAFLARQPLDQLSDLGFVILHRCGESFYFLIACSWQGNNELWESVWAKTADSPDFHDWSRPMPHQATLCVWELGAVLHEQQAWIHYLRSKRDEAAVSAWLADQYEGRL
ncbi:MAG TPA: hypothetical protein VGG36_00380 [Rhizomicrobium sp.]|jgi:hypothetical protein